MTGILRLLDRLTGQLRVLRDEERGQSLIVVALSLTVAFGIAAFAIDAATWYQAHHKAQVAYDASALAAANCLAHPKTGPNTAQFPQCTSSTDDTDATKVAVNYAQQYYGITVDPRYVDITTNPVTETATVKINQTTSAPVFFAVLFGMHSASVTAGSTASFTPQTTSTSTSTSVSTSTLTLTTTTTTPATTTTTTTPASSACTAATQAQCSAIYTKSTNCSAGTTLGTSSSGGAALSITGVVHSEGGMTISNNFSLYPASLSVAGSCYNSSDYPSANTNHTPQKVTATPVASEPWPIDFSQSPYFTACTSTCKTVSGIANVPPYCTQATTSGSGFSFYQNNGVYVLPQSGTVYCAIGTGNTKDPSTWNGPISFQTSVPQYGSGCSSSSNSKFTSATFIGGNITASNSQVCMNPASNGCLFYSNGNITLSNGQFYWSGTVFDPVGTIQLGTATSGGEQLYSVPNGLMEGQNFTIQNGQIDQLTGSGPVMSTSGNGGTTTHTTPGTTSTSTTTTTTTATNTSLQTTTAPGSDGGLTN